MLTFDIDEVKSDVESGNQGKKNKALWEAYHIAAEGHDLSYFKQMLAQHEKAMQDDLEQREQKEQEKEEKKKNKAEKAAKRKSTAAEESDDVDMEDAGEDGAPSAKKKGSKKRKKGDESEGENEKVRFSALQTKLFTDMMVAWKDAQNEAQADYQDAQRYTSKGKERNKGKEEIQRGSGANCSRGATAH